EGLSGAVGVGVGKVGSHPAGAQALVGLDAVVDAGGGERVVEPPLHLVGERGVLDRACHVDARLHARRQQVRAVGRVVGQVAAVESGGGGDAIGEMAGRRQRKPAAHAV